MRRSISLCLIAGLLAAGALAEEVPAVLARTPTTATTVSGDKVLLHPNGRWEFVDAGKAEQAKKIAEQYPENRTRPLEAQGGVMGVGRVILPGDKDYNRGSLNPKMR